MHFHKYIYGTIQENVIKRAYIDNENDEFSVFHITEVTYLA